MNRSLNFASIAALALCALAMPHALNAGPIAFSTNVTIREEDADGAPRTIVIQSRDRRLPLTLQLTVTESVRTPMALTRGPGGTMTFVQLGGEYRVSGRAGDVDVNFTARGSAETFRPNP